MSYIERSLGAGERIIVRARFHWLYVTAAWAVLLLPLLILLSLLIWAERRSQPFASNDPVTWYIVLAALLFLWGLTRFLGRMIHVWTTEIGVTSHRFVEKYGLLSMRTNEIALPNIEGVRLHQSPLGRLFGYGTVRVEGTGIDAVTTPTIADPVGFVRAIQTAREIPK